MTDDETQDQTRYAVVVNDEGYHSVWIAERTPPAGWSREGMEGTRRDCLAHIDRVWTDMRPLSLRRAYAARERADPPAG